MATVTTDLKQDVKNHLVWDDRLVTSGIEVDVQEDGSVILSGTVPSYYNRILAEEDVFAVPGVTKVENNLRIKYPESFSAFADGDLKTTIENMLLWDSRIDASHIKVEVNQGVVKLEGSVPAYWKKEIAEDHARRMIGVMEVHNNLNVVPTKDVVDEAVAEDIKNALRRNQLIDEEDVTVEVTNSFVTLRGRVASHAAKKLAYDTASFTKGVIGVRDLLEVQ